MSECKFDPAAEDVYEFIAQLIPETIEIIQDADVSCVIPITSQWNIVYSLVPNEDELNISALGYFVTPKIYGLMDTTSIEASGISATLNQPNLNIAGQGVIVGVVDTGLDYTLDSFRDSAGFTRVDVIWDQTLERSSTGSRNTENGGGRVYSLNETVPYGRVFLREEIDAALTEFDAGRDPYAIVPSRDELGHGTFLSGVAAASRTDTYMGAAPQAELAIVKLKEAKTFLKDYYLVNENAPSFSESDIMMGVRFLLDYATQQNKPLVILLGVGTGSGPRMGVSPLANLLDNATTRKNTVVVVPMGNEGDSRTHYRGMAVSDMVADQIEINVTSEGRGFVMEIWADTLDILSVSITSPSGERIPRIPARMGRNSEFTFLLENSSVEVKYESSGLITGYELIMLRFQTPVEGVWRVNVYSLTDIEGIYNAWLPIEELMSSKVYFVKPTPETTLTPPAATSRVISVGAYNHVTGAVVPFSGRGYTADDRVKPDLVAPGENVYGPVPGNRFEYRTGTSISAAHVAGAAALLLCWGVSQNRFPSIGSNEIKIILLRGASRDREVSYPNPVSGYGRLDLIQSFYQMRII